MIYIKKVEKIQIAVTKDGPIFEDIYTDFNGKRIFPENEYVYNVMGHNMIWLDDEKKFIPVNK